MSATPTVDFGPDQTVTTIGTVRRSQLLMLALGGVLPVWASAALMVPAPIFFGAIGMALTSVFITFWRLPNGKHIDQVAGANVRYFLHRMRRGRRRGLPVASQVRVAGRTGTQKVELPEDLAGLAFLRHRQDGRTYGIVHDANVDGYAVVLQLVGRGASATDDALFEAAMASWEDALQTVCQEQSIRRVQWIALSTPDDGSILRNDFERRSVIKGGPLHESHLRLLETSAPVAAVHECYLAIQVSSPKRSKGAPYHQLGAEAAVSAAYHVASVMNAGSYAIESDGLSPDKLGRVLNLLWHPSSRRLQGMQDATAGKAGTPLGLATPRVCEHHRRMYVTDGDAHRVFEIAWPQREVGVAFLRPLFLHMRSTMAVSVVYAPLDPAVEISKAEVFRSTSEAKDEQRAKGGIIGGFHKTFRRKRQEEFKNDYLEQVSAGAAPFKVTGWVSLSATSSKVAALASGNGHGSHDIQLREERAMNELLDESERALVRVVARHGVRLARRDGEHAQAFSYVLPTCRSIDGRWR